ncbi:PH domain-containing protein [uncultured Gelidibacter sp.]|uniref:PH domain-containing protein n=1 Tax=uncultured Gelidibacter sp. TaxID=259318 RepID=UPI0026118C0A|nr:PH domain-containing protein [uncultured Gelidibacter sp.]
MAKKYPSKISYGLLIFVFLMFYGPLLPDLLNGELNGKMIGLIGFLSVVFGFIVHLFFNTHYTIDHRKLKIKSGAFSYQPIIIDDIKEISKTNSVLSSPAASFDRIKINYGTTNSVILSPKDKYQFAEDLVKINPRIINKLSLS